MMLMGNQTCGKLHRCAFLGHFYLELNHTENNALIKRTIFLCLLFKIHVQNVFYTLPSSIVIPAPFVRHQRTPGTGEPGGQPPVGSHRVRHA